MVPYENTPPMTTVLIVEDNEEGQFLFEEPLTHVSRTLNNLLGTDCFRMAINKINIPDINGVFVALHIPIIPTKMTSFLFEWVVHFVQKYFKTKALALDEIIYRFKGHQIPNIKPHYLEQRGA